jgi:hypothetical protein
MPAAQPAAGLRHDAGDDPGGGAVSRAATGTSCHLATARGARRAGRRRIGLAWSGNPDYPNDHNRSIRLGRLEPLLTRTDCALHVVQTPIRATDRAVLDGLPSVKDHSAALGDFADTAALLSLVHLAGALARPTWLLLPFSAEWRWLTVRADSPWYPTMRLFRQPAPGDWDGVLAAVVRALDA